MIVSEELKRLSEIFTAKLYIVGGATRDHLLGYKLSDFDLSSSLTGEEVIELLKGTEFRVTPHSLKLGTLGIKVGKQVMEYTAFRKDSYGEKGVHSPTSVEFKVGIEQDAFRRDFTINAIYYDLTEGKFLDFTGGLKDLENRIVRTTREPKSVFEEDALRILRLVRIASKLGLDIEERTLFEAKRQSYLLKEIAVERIRDEFEKILIADTENSIADAQVRGLELLVEIGAMEYIVPELLESIGVKQPPKYHLYDVYNHILHTVKIAPMHLRLAALLHDVGKPRSIDEEGKMTEHPYVGAQMAKEIMLRLRYPHREIERVSRLVETHMYDLRCLMSDNSLRVFVLKNQDILSDLIELKMADHTAHGKKDGVSPSALNLARVFREMRENKVAFSLKELPVGGDTLVALKVKPLERAKVLSSLLEHGAYLGKQLDRDECIAFIKERIK